MKYSTSYLLGSPTTPLAGRTGRLVKGGVSGGMMEHFGGAGAHGKCFIRGIVEYTHDVFKGITSQVHGKQK